MIITAKDMNEAIGIAKRSPHSIMKSGPTTIRKIEEVPL